MSDLTKKIEILKENINEYPNFPKNGVLFRDMFSLFQNPELLEILRQVLVEVAKNISGPPVNCIAALDARGFLIGPLIALDLKVPFVPIRKKGKLPGNVASVSYSLEYGQDTLEIQSDSIKQGDRVLIVDDLLATGGSLGAACKLIRGLDGEVAACLVLMEITQLKGRANIPDVEVISILKY